MWKSQKTRAKIWFLLIPFVLLNIFLSLHQVWSPHRAVQPRWIEPHYTGVGGGSLKCVCVSFKGRSCMRRPRCLCCTLSPDASESSWFPAMCQIATFRRPGSCSHHGGNSSVTLSCQVCTKLLCCYFGSGPQQPTMNYPFKSKNF